MVKLTEDTFGKVLDPFTKRETTIRRFTMTNKNGISVKIITYGASIQSILLPDVNGHVEDICLGYDTVDGYMQPLPINPYIGGTIGRVCSRVGNARFTIDGIEYKVGANFLGKHQIHGGFLGFDKVIWDVLHMRPDGIVLQFISPDGHEGYPGELRTTLTYTLTEGNCFRFCFDAWTTKATPVNMTNHAYFNLAGHASGRKGMSEHMVMIKANSYTETDNDTVPTGRILTLNCTPIDCRKWTNVGEGLKRVKPGYDDNYVLNWKRNSILLQAKAYHPPSGRFMEISSNQPGMHFYTAHNMPDVENGGETPLSIGKGNVGYSKFGGFCMETHWYPDAMNHSNFPNVILRPGEKYNHICIFRLGASSHGPSEDKAVNPNSKCPTVRTFELPEHDEENACQKKCN